MFENMDRLLTNYIAKLQKDLASQEFVLNNYVKSIKC